MGFLDQVLSVGSALYPVAGGIAQGVNQSRELQRKLEDRKRQIEREKLQDQVTRAAYELSQYRTQQEKDAEERQKQLFGLAMSQGALGDDINVRDPKQDYGAALEKHRKQKEQIASYVRAGWTQEEAEDKVLRDVDRPALRRQADLDKLARENTESLIANRGKTNAADVETKRLKAATQEAQEYGNRMIAEFGSPHAALEAFTKAMEASGGADNEPSELIFDYLNKRAASIQRPDQAKMRGFSQDRERRVAARNEATDKLLSPEELMVELKRRGMSEDQAVSYMWRLGKLKGKAPKGATTGSRVER